MQLKLNYSFGISNFWLYAISYDEIKIETSTWI